MNLKFTTLAMLILLLAGCKDDDAVKYTEVDGLPPSIAMSRTTLRAEPGRTFHFEGLVEDKDGLKSIHLYCPEIFLDKTIEFPGNEPVNSYELKYMFKTTADVPTTSKFSAEITATDLGGRATKETVSILMDGDFIKPSFSAKPDDNISVLYVPNTPDPVLYTLEFSVEDNMGLGYVEISIPDEAVDFYDKVETFTDGGKKLDYKSDILFPTKRGEYTLTITAVDSQGNETSLNSVVAVTDEMPDYPKIYLADVATAAELNSDLYGVPMMVERSAEWTYVARYYNEKAGTQIRFIPQKTDFNPLCFGLDPQDNSILGYDPATVKPIVLDQVGYYRITVNIKELTYSVETYTPDDTPVAIGSLKYLDDSRPGEGTYELRLGLAGKTFPGVGQWNPADPLVLTQDPNNPYLFSAQTTLTAGDAMEFTITPVHPWGWWPEPFWRFDKETGEEAHVFNGGSNMAKMTVPATGKYMFKFDTHLLRSKFYRVN